MAIQSVNIGAAANDGTGDTPRVAFGKVNANFASVEVEIGTKLNANDASVTNARTPTGHKSTHAIGGSDALVPSDIGAATAAQGALAASALQPAAADLRYAAHLIQPSGDITGAIDVAAINAALVAYGYVCGVPGASYYYNAPIYLPSNSTLSMYGTYNYLVSGVLTNLMRTRSVDPSRTVTDGATTSGNGTVTSATANFTNADVGASIQVVGGATAGGSLYGTITAVTNATTVTVSTYANVTVSSAAINIYNTAARCKNVTMLGGYWYTPDLTGQGATNAATTALNSFCSAFRRVDGLILRDMVWQSAGTRGLGGRFTVSLGDVTNFDVRNLYFAGTSGDGFHFMGPINRGYVSNLGGGTGDDMCVGSVCDGYTGPISDTEGNVSNVAIHGLFPDTAYNAFKLYGPNVVSNQFSFSNISLDTVTGNCTTGGVQFNQVACDAVKVRNVKIFNTTGNVVSIGPCDWISSVDIDGVEAIGGYNTTTGIVGINNPRGQVVVRNVKLTGHPTGSTQIGVLITGKCGPSPSGVNYGCMFDLSNIYATPGTGTAPSYFNPVVFSSTTGIIQGINIQGIQAIPATGNTMLTLSAGTYYPTINLINCNYIGPTGLSLASSAVPVTIHATNCNFTGANFAVTSAPLTLMFDNCNVSTSGAMVSVAGTNATPVRVLGHNLIQGGAGALFAKDGSQVLSASGDGFQVDVSTLTPTKGDTMYNSNSSLAQGTGTLSYDGTAWRQLAIPRVTATLAAGTVTISNSAITTTSQITPRNVLGGYSGASGPVYVSAQSVGSVTISSTNASATNAVSVTIEN